MVIFDINVLLARADQVHPSHEPIKQWLRANEMPWATCPITENGFIRILGHPNYPGSGCGNTETAAVALRGMIDAIPGHTFLSDDISILDGMIDLQGIKSSDLTDQYLLALAVNHGARFLTLDRRIDPSPVPGGAVAMITL